MIVNKTNRLSAKSSNMSTKSLIANRPVKDCLYNPFDIFKLTIINYLKCVLDGNIEWEISDLSKNSCRLKAPFGKFTVVEYHHMKWIFNNSNFVLTQDMIYYPIGDGYTCITTITNSFNHHIQLMWSYLKNTQAD